MSAARALLRREDRSMPMPENYAASERLRDGRGVEIRMLRADDRDDMLAAIGRTSSQITATSLLRAQAQLSRRRKSTSS